MPNLTIPTGVSLDSTTAVTSDIISGKTAYDGEGNLLTGTMVNNGRWPNADKVTFEQSKFWMYKSSGYTEGGLGADGSTFGTASSGDVKSGVTFTSKNGLKLTGTYSLPSVNVTAGNMLSGTSAINSSGSVVNGSMTNRGTWTASINPGDSVVIPAGYHNGSGKVSATTSGVKNIKTKTITYNFTNAAANNSYTYEVTEGTLIGLTSLQVHHWYGSDSAVVNYYISGNTIHIDTNFSGGTIRDYAFTFAYY